MCCLILVSHTIGASLFTQLWPRRNRLNGKKRVLGGCPRDWLSSQMQNTNNSKTVKDDQNALTSKRRKLKSTKVGRLKKLTVVKIGRKEIHVEVTYDIEAEFNCSNCWWQIDLDSPICETALYTH